MNDRPQLRALADRVGILPAYIDISGVEQVTSDSARLAFLAAMGFEASTEAAAARTLQELDQAERERILPPVRVVRAQAEDVRQVRFHVPGQGHPPVDWRIELHAEDGSTQVAEGHSAPSNPDREIEVELPASPPPGYHTLTTTLSLPDGVTKDEQSLIVSPGHCWSYAEQTGAQRGFGLWANVYSLRRDRNWGIGDLTDLGELAAGAARLGADFVGLNPLHALRNRGEWIAPYCPVSRLFRNLVYLDVEVVPEFAECGEARGRYESTTFQEELAKLRAAPNVEYESVAALKIGILHLLHTFFVERHAGTGSARGRAYAEYAAAQGKPLVDFATFLALEDRFSKEFADDVSWRDWPAAYRSPDSPEVEAFRAAHRGEVDFYCYVQFELDRQLAATAGRARAAGMPLGLYQDLAIGSAADGSDAWAFPGLLVEGVEIGAPPDPYSDTGQTWGFPPVDPHRLRATRYEYWIQLLRHTLPHAGMLRIDHVMGLFRQFWVPDGQPATEGAYVRYPAEDLLGILALESQRSRTVIVGEDLGTVPPEVPPALSEWGMLSTRVMYFERGHDGAFSPSEAYSPRALVTATNHDHPPLAGFWKGRDLELRYELGLIESAQGLENARREREHSRTALVDRLIAEGFSLNTESPSAEELSAAVYAFLAQTPCPLLGVSLDDLAAETEPVNLPGVPPTRYRSWSRRMRRSFADILGDPAVQHVLEETRSRLHDSAAP